MKESEGRVFVVSGVHIRTHPQTFSGTVTTGIYIEGRQALISEIVSKVYRGKCTKQMGIRWYSQHTVSSFKVYQTDGYQAVQSAYRQLI